MLNQHKTIKENIAKYNKPNQLADFLLPLIEKKKDVAILDIGSGAYSIIGNYAHGVTIDLTLADSQDFTPFWKKYNAEPFLPVELMDMEDITEEDNTFDLVVCINALDHTKNALKAVYEMLRVCKPGGYVYIDCHLDQKDTGHKHFWNAKKDGTLTNGDFLFDLKTFGFRVDYIDNGGEDRYNRIVAKFQK